MDLYEILDGVEIDIDGVRMKANIQALRILPTIPRRLRKDRACWYDDGTRRTLINAESTITIAVDGDTPYPEVPPLTRPDLDDLFENLRDSWTVGDIPVIKLHPGALEFGHGSDPLL